MADQRERNDGSGAGSSGRRVQKGAKFELVTETVELPNGSRVELDLLTHPGAAAVLPFLDAETVLLIRQYRFATGGYLLEVPAGKLDADEAPEVCAARELEEETGYRPGRIEALTSIWTSPGFTDEVIHLFVAHDLERTTQQLEAHEIIELVPMKLADALDLVHRGELRDAKSVATLLLAARRADAAPPS